MPLSEFDEWCEDVRIAFNEILAVPGSVWELEFVNAWGHADAQHLTHRFREDRFRTEYRKVFEIARESPALRGGMRSGWIPNRQWFLRGTNYQKILNGQFTEETSNAPTARKPTADAHSIPERFIERLKRIGDVSERRELAGKLGVPDDHPVLADMG